MYLCVCMQVFELEYIYIIHTLINITHTPTHTHKCT